MSNSSSGEEIQGWLKKKGDVGLIKGWKNRWFQQKDDKIYYFKCRDDTESLGIKPLLCFYMVSGFGCFVSVTALTEFFFLFK